MHIKSNLDSFFFFFFFFEIVFFFFALLLPSATHQVNDVVFNVGFIFSVF